MISYTVIRSKRKTTAIYVHADGRVEVRAPQREAVSEIKRFVNAKTPWIEKQLAVYAARRQEMRPEEPAALYSKEEFLQVVHKLIQVWGPQLGVAPTFVGVRKMKTRWGSCTARTGRIRLNTALLCCPYECIEYIIVHELAHIKENNHSARFWAIVAAALPDYAARRKKLGTIQLSLFP